MNGGCGPLASRYALQTGNWRGAGGGELAQVALVGSSGSTEGRLRSLHDPLGHGACSLLGLLPSTPPLA